MCALCARKWWRVEREQRAKRVDRPSRSWVIMEDPFVPLVVRSNMTIEWSFELDGSRTQYLWIVKEWVHRLDNQMVFWVISKRLFRFLDILVSRDVSLSLHINNMYVVLYLSEESKWFCERGQSTRRGDESAWHCVVSPVQGSGCRRPLLQKDTDLWGSR